MQRPCGGKRLVGSSKRKDDCRVSSSKAVSKVEGEPWEMRSGQGHGRAFDLSGKPELLLGRSASAPSLLWALLNKSLQLSEPQCPRLWNGSPHILHAVG